MHESDWSKREHCQCDEQWTDTVNMLSTQSFEFVGLINLQTYRTFYFLFFNTVQLFEWTTCPDHKNSFITINFIGDLDLGHTHHNHNTNQKQQLTTIIVVPADALA